MFLVASILHQWREGPQLGPPDEELLGPAQVTTATPVATNVRAKVGVACTR